MLDSQCLAPALPGRPAHRRALAVQRWRGLSLSTPSRAPVQPPPVRAPRREARPPASRATCPSRYVESWGERGGRAGGGQQSLLK
eukprot:scaffold20941_cov34-Tisochrysis_lutea.AAC.6